MASVPWTTLEPVLTSLYLDKLKPVSLEQYMKYKVYACAWRVCAADVDDDALCRIVLNYCTEVSRPVPMPVDQPGANCMPPLCLVSI